FSYFDIGVSFLEEASPQGLLPELLFRKGYATFLPFTQLLELTQAAIDASVSGDTVLVSPGTYVENINYSGKDILVKSTEGAAVTTLEQGDGTESLVMFANNETRQAILDGFRIANSTYGAAIKCTASSPRITRCIIEDNISVGITFSDGSPSIVANEILDNGGPGIAGDWSGVEEIEITGNTIAGNYGHGIQIMQTGSLLLIEYNRLSQNRLGILVRYARGPVVIRHNLIANTLSENALEVSLGVGFEISSNTIYGGVRGIDIPYSETPATGTDNIIVGCSDWALYDPFHCLSRTMFWDNEQDWYSAYPVSPAKYIRANPEFTSPETGDFSLRCDSPAIDAGSPDLLDADGTRADIGAFPFNYQGGTPVAMDFSLLGENQFMVYSPKITFVWRPKTWSSETITIDTLFCISNPISGEEI
ncbi:MAG: right-handed parallel beta-helix repeat-containing protein, partial [Candidatus Zixiibacteriota bacterium]